MNKMREKIISAVQIANIHCGIPVNKVLNSMSQKMFSFFFQNRNKTNTNAQDFSVVFFLLLFKKNKTKKTSDSC